MIKITPLTDVQVGKFSQLFEEYYSELGCADNVKHLIDEYILPDLIAGLLKIDLAYDGETPAGFIIYQTDDITNEWNVKEGWGDIREIYVSPSSRRQGMGKLLLYTAELKLKESGATRAYCLPYEPSVPFFTSCGYSKTQEYDEDLETFVYEKNSLNNCCHK